MLRRGLLQILSPSSSTHALSQINQSSKKQTAIFSSSWDKSLIPMSFHSVAEDDGHFWRGAIPFSVHVPPGCVAIFAVEAAPPFSFY